MIEVLISGASIAGNALAAGLARAGCAVTVVERAPALRPGGYAIDIRGVALEVADRMGVSDGARQWSTDTEGTSFVDAAGRRIATLPLGFGVLDPADIEIMKGDLSRVLHQAVPAGVEWIFGDSVAELDQRGGRVAVRLERGGRREFDYVVGCDGIHSRVRTLAFPGDHLHHLGSNSAVFTAPNELGVRRWQLIHTMPGRVMSVKTDRGSREVKVTLLYGGGMPPRDRAERVRSIEAAFAGAGWVGPRLLELMRGAPDLYVAPNAQVRMPGWTAGRVALVGDAGYAPSALTGQGTGMALVGAYLLARHIASGGELGEYDREMHDFVKVNQRAALGAARGFAPKSELAARMMSLSIRMLPYLPGRNLMFATMTRPARRAASALILPTAMGQPV
ncbi:FAD-dependent monooxygenase [Dactylosporangium vinaceum]|uniref:FAD-dependent monooxygenase n=1 Tax=Dactylosporangium vinaceum TaxID=53362 RepID=A0ABV5M7H3_9ACTN|nr:FAD-dependent monooxygenase [Dactylosporangium vinaceum]UAB95354.1 FAD-dependent monooxygenase [Dactylosporangium vinaceum]